MPRCQSLQTTTSPGPQSSISALVHCYTPHAADAAVRCEPRSAERGARPGDNDSCGQGHCLRPRDGSILEIKMYSLCLRSPLWHLVTGRAVLLFVGLGLGCFLFCFLALVPHVLVVKKCGLGTNVPRWGWQHGSVHKIGAGLELLPKFRLFLRK